MAGDQDDRNISGLYVRGELALEVATAETWQTEIKDDGVGPSEFDPRKRGDAVGNRADYITGQHQLDPVEVAQFGIILDDKNRRPPGEWRHALRNSSMNAIPNQLSS